MQAQIYCLTYRTEFKTVTNVFINKTQNKNKEYIYTDINCVAGSKHTSQQHTNPKPSLLLNVQKQLAISLAFQFAEQ